MNTPLSTTHQFDCNLNNFDARFKSLLDNIVEVTPSLDDSSLPNSEDENFDSLDTNSSTFLPPITANSLDPQPSTSAASTVNVNVENDETRQELGKKLTRKRVPKPEKWRKNVLKEQFAKGLEHETTNKAGEVVFKRARELQAGCDLSCRRKCHLKISKAERLEIFKNFWEIPTQVEKWGFIGRHLKINEIKRSYLLTPQKKSSREFYFQGQNGLIQVCKTMFKDTLDITDSWIETVVKKLENKGFIASDMRGKNPKTQMSKTEELRVSIRKHIDNLQRMPSHYSRENTHKEYLVQDFQSVVDLYSNYETWMSEVYPNEAIATIRQYRDVFNFEYNISFFLPKKDLCDVCCTWENTPENEKTISEKTYLDHIKNKNTVVAMKDSDTKEARLKTSTTLVVAHFDYEKALICPKGNVSVFYYKRKLSVNNFTIVDVGRFEDCCYVYDETIAKKGSNEVASFLFHFIIRKVEAGMTEFRFYSDNCVGQNKNRNLTTLFLYASSKFNIKIVHTFLEKGHTYNAADTVHSLIERKTRPLQIHIPSMWYDSIAAAKRSKQHPIVLVKVTQDMIFDWKDLADKLYLDKDVHKSSIPWIKIRQISFDGSKPHEFQFKVNFDDEFVSVSTKSVGRPVNFNSYELKNVYQGTLPISKLKHKDLMHYCERKYIPVEYHDYYRELPTSENIIDADEEDIVDEPVVGRARKRKAVSSQKKKNYEKKIQKNKKS